MDIPNVDFTFVYLFLFLKIDPRIRTGSAVSDLLELPLLTTVPHMKLPSEKTPFFQHPRVIIATVAFMFAMYVVVFFVKHAMEATSGGGI